MKLSNWFTRDGAERPLIWPCVTLVLLFVLDLWVNPHFLSLRMLDGHLFGAPIDVSQSRGAAGAGRDRHDACDRDTRHRYLGRRGRRDCRRGRGHASSPTQPSPSAG